MGCANSSEVEKNNTNVKQGQLVLGYWGIRLRATVSKYLLEYTGQAYTEEQYKDPKEWFGSANVKQQSEGFIFTNLPYLKDGQFIMTEAPAIEQYIIKRSGDISLIGANLQEQAQIRMLWSTIMDFRNDIVDFITKTENFEGEKTEKWEKIISGWVELYSNHLGDKLWLQGANISWPDFTLYETLQWVKGIWPEQFAQNSKLIAFCQRFEDLPKIKEYLNSSRHIKYPFFPPYMSKWTGIPQEQK